MQNTDDIFHIDEMETLPITNKDIAKETRHDPVLSAVLTRLDLHKHVREIQLQQSNRKNAQTTRTFEEGQSVLARDYRSGKPKWIKGIISKVFGNLNYQIKTTQGAFWRRHTDQIRSASQCIAEAITEATGGYSSETETAGQPATANGAHSDSGRSPVDRSLVPETVTRRYPKRQHRRVPDKLTF